MRIRNLLALLLVLLVSITGSAQSAKLKGRVMDSSGSIMPGVQVKLYQGDKVVQQGLSTDMGEFELAVNPGDYKLEVTAPDFNTYTEMVKVSGDTVPLAVTMQLATVAQNVDVTETRNEISIDSDSSLQTTVLKQDFIDALPDDEDELASYLSQIAGTRGAAGGGATFVIDGFTGGRIPPKDQIQEIRISNNPYSSEFSGIGFGRTEIITKAGTGDYHGNFNFEFRDATLNARDPFLATRPPAQTRNFQSNFSGPIIRNKLSLNLNARHFYNDNTNTIRATIVGADGNPLSYSAPSIAPNKNKNMNARTQYAVNKNNTLFVNYQYQHQERLNQGPGQFTLLDRAADNSIHNSEYQMRETAILTKSIVHETRFEYRRDFSQTTPRNFGQAVNVLDSFNRGGGQNNSLNNNKSYEFSNLLMYSGNKWTVKAGFNALNRVYHTIQQNNFLGTYTFSTLSSFIANTPLQYTQTSGNPLLDVNQLELATFIQTDRKLTRKLNIMLGARYEAQTNIDYHKGFDPRIGFAYEITKTMALRGGIGTFHQRLDESIVEGVLRLDGTHQTQITIANPYYQPGCETGATCNPLLGGNGVLLPQPPPTIRTRGANLVTPYTQNASLSLEKTLPGGLGLTFSWDYQRGQHLYRSRDINAPLPVTGITPDPTKGIVYQLESSGVSRSNNFTIGFREQARNRFNLQIFGNYTLGYQKNDTDGWTSTPVNNYDMSSEWGRSGNDMRHRFFTGSNFRLPALPHSGPLLFKAPATAISDIIEGMNFTNQINWQSSRPYNITNGSDFVVVDSNGVAHHDLVINARPTEVELCQFLTSTGRTLPGQSCASPANNVIARNTGIGPSFFNIQMNVQKTVRLKRAEKANSGNRASNGRPNGANNFLQGGGGGFQGGGGFPGGGGNFPGGGQRGPDGGGPGGFGGQRGNGGNNGGFNNNQNSNIPTVTFRFQVQNVFNSVQFQNFSGTMTSPYFGKANAARNPRQVEAGVRFNF
jgi:Carboxypeptidase regulatory-like domain